MKHLNITVFGKVQGVFFRAETKSIADGLGVKGYVKNQSDGSVFIEAEADESTLEIFIQWCRKGSTPSTVNEIKVEEGKTENFSDFEIR